MTLPAHRRLDNIHRTIQVQLGDTITTASGGVYAVIHDHPWRDPGGVRQDASAQEALGWVVTTWIGAGAGRKGSSFLQATVMRRILSEGETGADPQGLEAGRMVDALVDRFSGTQGGGHMKACATVLDFANPAVPVDTGEVLVCLNSRGEYGEPEEVLPQPLQADGLRITVVRWRFALAQDLTGPAGFYTT